MCSAGAHVPARPLASLCLFLRTPMSCHTDQHTTVDSGPMVQRRGSDGAVHCWCGDSAVLYTVSGLHPRASHTQCCHACSSIAHRGLPRTETYHHIPIAGHYRAVQSIVLSTVRHRAATQSITQSIAQSIALQVRLTRASQGIVYVSCRHPGEYRRASPRIAQHYVALKGTPLHTHTHTAFVDVVIERDTTLRQPMACNTTGNDTS